MVTLADSANAADPEFLGNTWVEWVTALGIAAAVFIVLWVIKNVLLARVAALARKVRLTFADLPVSVLQATRNWFLAAVGLYVGTQRLELTPDVERWITYFLVVAIAVQAAIWGRQAVLHLVDGFLDKRRLPDGDIDGSLLTTMNAVRFIALLILYSLALLMALDNLGVDVTALIAGLGVGGIAVALAVQNILGDLFASLSIVLDKPFVVGDFIIVGEQMGTVERIGLKTTRVKSLSGEQLVFSNADLLNSRIRNFKRMAERRAVFHFGVLYQTDYETLKKIPTIVREAVEKTPNTRFDRSHFFRYGESSLEFETVYFMLVPDFNSYMDAQQSINLELFRRFKQEGIEFAYPTRTLHVETLPPRRPAPRYAASGDDADSVG